MSELAQVADLGDVFDEAETSTEAEVSTETEAEFEELAKGDKPEEVEATEDKTEEAETEAEEETPSSDDNKQVPMSAFLGMQKNLKADIEQLKAENEQLRKYAPQEEDNAPDPTEDPEAYEAHVERKILNRKVKRSDDAMTGNENYPDYRERRSEFMVLASNDTDLVTKMYASENPALFAYEKAKEWRDGIRAEIKAEVEAEYKAQGKQKERPAALDVPDLTKTASKGKNTEQKAFLEDLGDMFGDSPF